MAWVSPGLVLAAEPSQAQACPLRASQREPAGSSSVSSPVMGMRHVGHDMGPKATSRLASVRPAVSINISPNLPRRFGVKGTVCLGGQQPGPPANQAGQVRPE